MASILFRKMLRDMKASAAAYILCGLVVMLGLCGYSVMKLCYDNLSMAREVFFRESDFCDGFADTAYTLPAAARRLEEIPGIASAEGRLVQDVQGWPTGASQSSPDTVQPGGDTELHLVSWTDGQMNRPVLSRGTMPAEGRAEMVIGEGMAKARGIKPGDTMEVAAGGRRVAMKITGIGMTPENIYMIRDMNELFPSPESYDAAFTSYRTASWLCGRTGSVNSFLVRLEPGTVWDDVKAQVEQTLEPYGMISCYPQTDQTGAAMVDEEIKQLDKMAGVVPLLFLSVAGVVLAITLSRMVEQQRAQIGTMMAIGVPGWVIRLHYMGFGVILGAVGGLTGTLLGYLLAGPMADYYRVYFNLPAVATPLSARYLAVGTLGAGTFCAAISWMIAGAAGRLTPARALRPEPPPAARKSVLERIPGFLNLLTVPGVMAVRSLSRNRKRTAFSLIGMSVAFMLTATLVSMNAMFDVFIFDYWEKTQRQDLTVYFERPVRDVDALEAVRHPGVLAAEGVMEFPVTLAGISGELDCTVQAVRPDSAMLRLYRADGAPADVPQEGIVLSEHMARTLGVQRGGTVEVRVTVPEERKTRVTVTDVIAQYMGSSAYMSYEGAARAGGYQNVYNSVCLKASRVAALELRERLVGEGAVSLVQSRGERLAQYRNITGSMSGVMFSMSMLGMATGLAVVCVSSLIRFEEMKRELATLMQLGMSSRECLDVLSVSQWILAAGSAVLGIPMAVGVSRLMSAAMSTDMYTLPNMLDGRSVLGAAALTGISVMLGSAAMLRKLKKISPVDFLRERE